MKTNRIWIWTWSLLLVTCLAMMGCNTIEGMGEDIESGGNAIQDAAD